MKNRNTILLSVAFAVAAVLTIAPSAAAQVRTDEVITGNYQNPEQLAIKGWWQANESAVVDLSPVCSPSTICHRFAHLNTPGGVVFDGTNIWTSHINVTTAGGNDNYFDKLQASDGKYITSFRVGDDAGPSAFDGVNIIGPDHNPAVGRAYFVRASDGDVTACSLGGAAVYADSAAFDGQFVWVSTNSGYVVKLSFDNVTRTCSRVCTTVNLGSRLYDLATDGFGYMWVTAVDTNSVIELNSSCTAVATVAVPGGPIGIVFDGTSFWTANETGNSISQIVDNGPPPATGGVLESTTPLSYSPWWIAYDGANVWTTGPAAGVVSKMSIAFPFYTLADYQACGSAASFPLQIAFDGANMWVGCEKANLLGKM